MHTLFRQTRWWLMLCLWAPFGLVHAAGDSDTYYDVEVLVFAALGADQGGELSPTVLGNQDISGAVPLGAGYGILPLLEGPRGLQAAADAMRRSSQYRPLLHWRWRQPGWERGQARAIQVDVPTGAALPVTGLPKAMNPSEQPLLKGTLMLSRSRYLHFSADLVYTDPTRGTASRLLETRRMRSNELHYLDNPRLGVLVRATPYEGTPSGATDSP